MPALHASAATRTPAGFDVELGDDRHDGWQIGLILHHLSRLDQFDVAVGANAARNRDDAIDLLRRRRGPHIGLMAVATAWLFLAFFELSPAKRARLAMAVATLLLELFAEALVVFLQPRAAPLQASVVFFEPRELFAELLSFAFTTTASATHTNRGHHGKPLFRGRFIKVRFSRCTHILRGRSRGPNENGSNKI